MALITRKQQPPRIFVFTTLAVGDGYAYPEGAILVNTTKNGKAVPPVLVPHLAVHEGPILPGRKVFEFDPDEFERHVADEQRRQSTPQPVGDRSLTVAEIVRDVLNGDAETFQRADALGFPRQLGRRVNGSRVEGLWRERDVRRWAEQIRITAAALTK